jgi:hypothetical protein
MTACAWIDIKQITPISQNISSALQIFANFFADAAIKLESKPDWMGLNDHDFLSCVGPILYKVMLHQGLDRAAPKKITETCKLAYINSTIFNALLLHDLDLIVSRLYSAGIRVIVLKGGFLARAVYPEIGLRPMSDLDILIRELDIPTVQEIVESLGYRQPTGDELSGDSARRTGHALRPYIKGVTAVEFHWNIEDVDSPFQIDPEDIWRDAYPGEGKCAYPLCISPEDLLLHVSIHGSYNHGDYVFGNGLYPLFDVAAIIRRYKGILNWSALVRRSQAWGVSHCIFITLIVTERLFSPGVPVNIIKQLAPEKFDPTLVEIALDLMFSMYQFKFRRYADALSKIRCRPGFERLRGMTRLRRSIIPEPGLVAPIYPRLAKWAGAGIPNLAYIYELLVDVGAIARDRDLGFRKMYRWEQARLRLLRWLTESTT